VLTHLDERAPTLVIQEVHAKLITVAADTTSAHQGKGRADGPGSASPLVVVADPDVLATAVVCGTAPTDMA
jgi:hypothetical protein